VLKVGAGTYKEPLTLDIDWLTIEATGEVDETIIETLINIPSSANHSTIDGFTIKGKVISTAEDVTIKNCAFDHKPLYDAAGEQITSSEDRLLVEDCTFDLTYSTYADTGIVLAGGADVTIDGCTFTLDDGAGTVTTQDKAINVTGTSVVTGLTVKNCAVGGDRGIGYYDHASTNTTADVKDSTFNALQKAFDIDNSGTVLSIRQNTITESYRDSVGAIDITDVGTLNIISNTIQDSVGYSVYARSGVTVTGIKIIGNNLVDNAKGLRNATTTTLSAAINNWWGDVSGPTISTNPDGTGDKVTSYVTYNPWLTASASLGKAATGATSLDAESTVGVKVSGLTTAADIIWVAQYPANPYDVEPTYDALEGAWFDVYISGGSSPAILKFYADGVDKNTDVHYWSKLENKWLSCDSQAASASGGYVWANITTTSEPTFSDLGGTPFVLVAAPAAAETKFTLTAPEAGATVPLVKNVPFTWASVTDATSYDLVISANADLSAPIVEETSAGTAYTHAGPLTDGKAYYWQVTAMREDTVKGVSDVGTFITQLPVAAVVPEVIVEAAPPAQITVEVPDITVEAPAITVESPAITVQPAPPAPVVPAAPLIPDYLLWVIIGIGAVLVIALIVLIVRTRRVA